MNDPSQNYVDSPKNIRCEASSHFRKKQKVNLKDKFEELETNNKINLYKFIKGFIKDY